MSIGGILVASPILATISDGLIPVNLDAIWVTLVDGVLVFAAVLLGRSRRTDLAGLLRRALPFLPASAAGGRP